MSWRIIAGDENERPRRQVLRGELDQEMNRHSWPFAEDRRRDDT